MSFAVRWEQCHGTHYVAATTVILSRLALTGRRNRGGRAPFSGNGKTDGRPAPGEAVTTPPPPPPCLLCGKSPRAAATPLAGAVGSADTILLDVSSEPDGTRLRATTTVAYPHPRDQGENIKMYIKIKEMAFTTKFSRDLHNLTTNYSCIKGDVEINK